MSTTKSTLSDDALLPSPAGAGAGAGQPAITPWLQQEDQRITSHLTDPQRRWVIGVCEASHAAGGKLTPVAVIRAGIDRLMGENQDAARAAEALSAG